MASAGRGQLSVFPLDRNTDSFCFVRLGAGGRDRPRHRLDDRRIRCQRHPGSAHQVHGHCDGPEHGDIRPQQREVLVRDPDKAKPRFGAGPNGRAPRRDGALSLLHDGDPRVPEPCLRRLASTLRCARGACQKVGTAIFVGSARLRHDVLPLASLVLVASQAVARGACPRWPGSPRLPKPSAPGSPRGRGRVPAPECFENNCLRTPLT